MRTMGRWFQELRFARSALMLFGILVLVACADAEEKYVERPVEGLYNEALNRLNSGD